MEESLILSEYHKSSKDIDNDSPIDCPLYILKVFSGEELTKYELFLKNTYNKGYVDHINEHNKLDNDRPRCSPCFPGMNVNPDLYYANSYLNFYTDSSTSYIDEFDTQKLYTFIGIYFSYLCKEKKYDITSFKLVFSGAGTKSMKYGLVYKYNIISDDTLYSYGLYQKINNDKYQCTYYDKGYDYVEADIINSTNMKYKNGLPQSDPIYLYRTKMII